MQVCTGLSFLALKREINVEENENNQWAPEVGSQVMWILTGNLALKVAKILFNLPYLDSGLKSFSLDIVNVYLNG